MVKEKHAREGAIRLLEKTQLEGGEGAGEREINSFLKRDALHFVDFQFFASGEGVRVGSAESVFRFAF